MVDQMVSSDLQYDITMLAPPEGRDALRAAFGCDDYEVVYTFLRNCIITTREQWTTDEIITKYQDGTLLDFGRDLERGQKALKLHMQLSAELSQRSA